MEAGEIETMYRFLCYILPAMAWCQTGTLSINTSTPSGRPGSELSFTVDYNRSDGASMQWTLVVPQGFTHTTVVGPAGTAAGKQVSCGPVGSPCLLWGLNVNTVAAGTVGVVSVPIPAGTPPGPKEFSLSGVVVASPAGTKLNAVPGPLITISILPLVEDLNGDGKVDLSDVGISVSQANGSAPCSNGDVNGDSTCDIIDVHRVIRAALGLN